MPTELVLTAISFSCYWGIDNIGRPIVRRVCSKYSKGASEKSVAELAQRYERVKSIRGDVDQYLTEWEKRELDSSIEQAAFDLMALEESLQQIRNIRYWEVKKIGSGVVDLGRKIKRFDYDIVLLHDSIFERSTQGRKSRAIATDSTGETQSTAQPDSPSRSSRAELVLNDVLTGKKPLRMMRAQGVTSGSESISREIIGTILEATRAESPIGTQSEGEGMPQTSLGVPENSSEEIQQGIEQEIPARQRTEHYKGVPRWHIESKSTSAPASLVTAPEIELDTFEHGVHLIAS